jgi:predicted nucleotidyltransferase
MHTEITQLLQELKEALSDIYGENLSGLYLYGSYATHEEDPESDVDVAIVLKDFDDYWEEIQRTGSIISELSLKYHVSISPVRVREADWVQGDSPYLHAVQKECVPV